MMRQADGSHIKEYRPRKEYPTFVPERRSRRGNFSCSPENYQTDVAASCSVILTPLPGMDELMIDEKKCPCPNPFVRMTI
jgi:hypothetical protein